MPSPANYNTISASSFVRQSAPEYRIGTAPRYQSNGSRSPENVGPGAYEPKKVIGEEGNKFSMSWKQNFDLVKNSRNLPGPGQYDVNKASTKVFKSLPSYGIGTSERPYSK